MSQDECSLLSPAWCSQCGLLGSGFVWHQSMDEGLCWSTGRVKTVLGQHWLLWGSGLLEHLGFSFSFPSDVSLHSVGSSHLILQFSNEACRQKSIRRKNILYKPGSCIISLTLLWSCGSCWPMEYFLVAPALKLTYRAQSHLVSVGQMNLFALHLLYSLKLSQMPCRPQVPPKNGTGHLFGCLQSMETLLSFSAKGEQCNLNTEVNYSNGNFSYRLSDVRLVLLFSRIEVSEMPLLMKNVLMANTFHNVMVILGFV